MASFLRAPLLAGSRPSCGAREATLVRERVAAFSAMRQAWLARAQSFAPVGGDVDIGGVREWLSRQVAPPPDPGLDAFRDAIGALSLDGVVVGYVASRVDVFWGLGRPAGLQECLWLYFHYLDDPDGNAERRYLWEEDYPPWTLRPELENGSFHDHDREATYAFRWLEGAARREAFDLIGLDNGVSS